MTIVRHSFSSRIGKIVDVNGVPHQIIRPVYWKQAIEENPDLAIQNAWKFFYYEVKPIETKETTTPSRPTV